MKTTKSWSKMLLAGMAAMVLALGLVLAGCENGVQEVEGTVKVAQDKPAGVASVTAVLTTGNLLGQSYKGVIISWDAVDNAQSYSVYYQQEGKKTMQSSYYVNAQSDYTYAAADGAQTLNTDIDKWSALAKLGGSSGITVIPGKKYRFGIQTQGFDNNSSDIVWSGYVTAP
jgi:hypothetical protein